MPNSPVAKVKQASYQLMRDEALRLEEEALGRKLTRVEKRALNQRLWKETQAAYRDERRASRLKVDADE